MARFASAQAAEMKYGVLITNHTPESCKVTLTKQELWAHACICGHDIRSLLQQQHTPLFEEVGIDISVECRQPSCLHRG